MSSAPDRIVMIGTDPATHGGIATALATWEAGGLFAAWPVTYIATHCDGTKSRRLSCRSPRRNRLLRCRT